MEFDIKLGASVGVVVRDLDPVLALYTEGLGLGPFDVEEVRVSGERSATLRIASAPLGPCEMELIEVTSGRPPHSEFLDERGEGMNCLLYTSPSPRD